MGLNSGVELRLMDINAVDADDSMAAAEGDLGIEFG